MNIKSLLLILFLSITYLNSAQVTSTKYLEESKEFSWGNDPAFNDEIPDKWKNESAVIIYKNISYHLEKFGGISSAKLHYIKSTRKRVKLLDKAAIDNFSELSFENQYNPTERMNAYMKKSNTILGIKIIKSNGKIINVNVSDDAVVTEEVTKVAVPNLEVGDIIDYYIYKLDHDESESVSYKPEEHTLTESYPVVDFKLYIEARDHFFINFNSYNGSPEIKQLDSPKKSIRRYEMSASDLEKSDFPNWFYPLAELPCYKLQVYFARSNRYEKITSGFLPEEHTIIKKEVTDEDIITHYKRTFKPYGNLGPIEKYFKQTSAKNYQQKATKAYNFIRHYYLTRLLEAVYGSEAKILNPYEVYGSNGLFFQTRVNFINYYIAYLKDNKIPYEVILGKNRYDGAIEDLLLSRNLEAVLKIKTKKPLYISLLSKHSNIGYIPPTLEGINAYVLTYKKHKLESIKKGELPVSIAENNESLTKMDLSFNDDFTTINVVRNNAYKGHSKTDKQDEILLVRDYINAEHKKYKTKSYLELVKNKKLKAKQENELNALFEKLETKRKEKLLKTAQSETDLENLTNFSFKILETGRENFNDYFVYEDVFTAKNNFMKKAGKNYIFEVGKLIGGQISLKDKTRDANVYRDYARTIKNEININIPEGYTVSGLDKLNINITNETGAFLSVANIEDGKLTIATHKTYAHNFEAKENWPKMVAFLDAAYQFTQEKILFKKI